MIEELISDPVANAHISLCIMRYGAGSAQDLFHCDLLNDDTASDLLILCALVYSVYEDMVKKMAVRLIKLLGRNVVVQQYGIKALMLAVRKGDKELVQMFLELGVDPFASEPGFHNQDLWRVDRWYHLFEFIKCGLDDDIPVEWVLHPVCSTAFQTACLTGNMEAIDSFVN